MTHFHLCLVVPVVMECMLNTVRLTARRTCCHRKHIALPEDQTAGATYANTPLHSGKLRDNRHEMSRMLKFELQVHPHTERQHWHATGVFAPLAQVLILRLGIEVVPEITAHLEG